MALYREKINKVNLSVMQYQGDASILSTWKVRPESFKA